jgi:hypothetical protein
MHALKKTRGFRLDLERLETVVLAVHNAAKDKKGLFQEGIKSFLPQWNLPKELENDPQTDSPKKPYLASLFLWTRLFCDRLSSSKQLIKRTLEVWYDPKLKWIYFPKKVIERDEPEIDDLLRLHLKFGLTNSLEESNGKRFKHNAEKLVKEYDSDPRNLINYKTVHEARTHLKKFKGIDTGLANLYIVELYDRKIAQVTNPKETLLKIDRHKGGIPIYTNAIVPVNAEVDSELLVRVLEPAYREIIKKKGLDVREIDAELWILGSQGCARNNFEHCVNNCPLYRSYCVSKVPLGRVSGRYEVYDAKNKRKETRKGNPQLRLF